jgi:phosphatidylglycerophosphate synthase
MVTDAADGELARIQHRASASGMLLDATADRLEEVMMYCGISYYLATQNSGSGVVWVVAACGTGLCVSYVKAKGESAIASRFAGTGTGFSHDALNRRFQIGVAGLKIRRYISVIGIASGLFVPMAILLTALSLITFVQRWLAITRALSSPPTGHCDNALDGDR